MPNDLRSFYLRYLWWPTQVFLTLLSGFFLMVGVQVFKMAYTLKDPFSFIMTFFASNLMIMISAVLMISFIWKMVAVARRLRRTDNNEVDNEDNG